MRSTLRFVLFAAGQTVLWSSVFLVIGGLAAIGSRSSAPDADPLAAPVAIAIGLAGFGLGTLLSARAYRFTSGVLSLVYALVLLSVAILLAPAAFALAQFSAAAFDPEQAAAAAFVGAGLALLTGAVLVRIGLRWVTAAPSRPRLRVASCAAAIAYGTMLSYLAVASALGALGVAVAGDDAPDQLSGLAAAAGLGAVLTGAGLLLTYHGVNALMGAPTGRLRVPPAPLLLGLWLAAVAVGWGLLDEGALLTSAFPIAFIVAAFGAGAALIAVVVRQRGARTAGRALTWRATLLCWAWGAAGATLASVYVEIVVDGAISLAFLTATGAFTGVTTVDQFMAVWQDPDTYLSRGELLAATLMLFSVSPPLVEESMKGMGVRLLGRSGVSRFQAFALGVACGAGFGTLEAVLYGASALEEAPDMWWSLMLLRGGATSMHALTSGVFGLGIFFAVNGRLRWTTGCIAAAMLMHGAWNGMSVIAVSDALPLLENLSDREVENLLAIVLGGWSLVNAAIIVLAARVLWREEVPEGGTAAVVREAATEAATPIPSDDELLVWRRRSSTGPHPPTPLWEDEG